MLLHSGTRGSILLLELEDAALTITESSVRLVDRVTLTVAAMDNILQLSLRAISFKSYLSSLLLLSPDVPSRYPIPIPQYLARLTLHPLAYHHHN